MNTSVLLISIDALKPEFVMKSEKVGLKLPNIKKYFLENGTYASKGVKSIFPTFTYPCHQTIITGTHPATHGTCTNKYFDPTGEHKDAWYWFVSDKVPNLWDYAKSNGYLTVNVAYPTSIGAKADYNIPEFWRDGTSLDSKIIDAVSRPQGIVKEIENEIGIFPGGLDLSLDSDCRRQAAAIWMLKNKVKPEINNKPFFMTAYFAAYDDITHINGVYSDEALAALEKTDELLGELISEAHRIAQDNIVVSVISDHGVIDNVADIRPNTLFYKAGLIKADESGKVTDWDVWCQRSGGCGYIKLKNPESNIAQEKVKDILNQLQNDEESCILEILTREQAIRRKGFPECDYVIISKLGYEIREDILGEYYSENVYQKAQHGYSEEYIDMRASFFIEGANIERNKDIGQLDLVDIAPTLANIMGFTMPSAEGKTILLASN